jgi:methylmalonyl-CoA mutase cobalamin-binding subunit
MPAMGHFDRADLLPEGLPPGEEIVRQGRALGRRMRIGKARYMRELGVGSEAEYKRRMRANGQIMFHAQYSATSWEETARGLKYIYEEVNRRGARIDRWGLSLDRVMGLPPEMRDSAPRETGLKLSSAEEWLQIGDVLPIPIHYGDHIVGTPASVSNLRLALETGGTTIGNLAHYFAYEYPGWTDQVTRTIDTVKALGAIAELKDKGVVIESNLNDGLGSIFHDVTTMVGWALLEKYIIEELIGAELVHVFGNVVTDVKLRLALLFAIDEIHGGETAGPHINANTILTEDTDRNASIVASSLLFDIIGQLVRPTGHAVQAIPLTEHERVPTPEEVVQVQVLANQLEREARGLVDIVDFRPVERLKDRLIQSGQVFRDRVLRGLTRMGVDVTDPIEILLALRGIGGTKLEELFGVGEQDDDLAGGRSPVVPSNMYNHALAIGEKIKEDLRSRGLSQRLQDKRVLLASTDVHEFGKVVVGIALKEAGAQVVDLGVSVDADAIAKATVEAGVHAICISTHNGMALSYAQDLLREMKRYDVEIPAFMGGKLNQDVEGKLPRDVTADLRELGIIPCNDILYILEDLKSTH